MEQRKRICQILFILVLCILIVYMGRNWMRDSCDVSGEAAVEWNRFLIEQSRNLYLSGISYSLDKDGTSAKQWLEECAFQLIPLGNYVTQNALPEIDVEDVETYEMILKKQAEDEPMIDENGNLVGGETKEQASLDEVIKKDEQVSFSMEKLEDFEYLVSHFYTVDGTTSVTSKDLDAKKLLKKDMTIDQSKKGPKILIYHTHSQEEFRDSKKGNLNTTIWGMGKYLTKLLNETYGIETIHLDGVYDLIDGKMDRSKAYQFAEADVKKMLEKYPSIEVVIDLHRDGVGEKTHLVTEIDGKQTAQIMFFNGMSRTKTNGDIAYLYNPYIQDNLAFSLQMQIIAMQKYPGFTRRIYLKGYRYNMHLKPKSLLVEAGAQTNTVGEMKNAMVLLADVLSACITGK